MEKVFNLQKETYLKLIQELLTGKHEAFRYNANRRAYKGQYIVSEDMTKVSKLLIKVNKLSQSNINELTKEDLETIKGYIKASKEIVSEQYKTELLEFMELLERNIKG